MEAKPPSLLKQAFFENNDEFTELEIEKPSLGNFQDISKDSHDIWLLQCPKNADLSQLEGQKIKLPGRSNYSGLETVAVESNQEKMHAFGYINRKRKSCLRLLPIRGTIVVRSRLNGNKAVDAEDICKLCPPPERVPLPTGIRVRHPLLGHKFTEQVKLKTEIVEKLENAHYNNLRVMNEMRVKSKSNSESRIKVKDEYSLKKSGKKRKHETDSESNAISPKKANKLLSPKKEVLDDDLQWLHQL